MPCVRAIVLAAALAFALAGCMHMADEDDWDAYDSGRGLGFGIVLTILLIVGVVLLVTNLAGAGRPSAPPPPPSPPPPPAAPPRPEPEAMGWEPVRPARAPARAKADDATKPAKPRRRAP